MTDLAVDMDEFFGGYATALVELVTTGSTEAATACYEYPALVVRDEVSWGYDSAAPLARDFGVLREQARAAGIVAADVEVTMVEPLTEVLTSVDVDWDFTDADGVAVLQQGWRYVVRTTPDGPRIRSVAIRTRAEP